MASQIDRRRWALITLFFLPGFALASWVTRTPAIRDRLGASTAEMGMVLFGLSVGAMAGVLASAPLVARAGTRSVVTGGLGLVVLSLAVVAAGAAAGLAPLVALGLGLFGLGAGSMEVALNIEGAEVEARSGRALMSALHGCFSLGTLVGAGLGIAVTATGAPAAWHLLGIGLTIVPAAVAAVRHIPPGFGRAATGSRRVRGLWREPRIIGIGLIVLAMALAEGSANDWLPLIMVDGHGLGETGGSLVFAAFAAAMTAGRFLGNRAVGRFGRVAMARASAISAAAGIGLVILSAHPGLAGAGVVLWGLGAALGFPIAMSAAAESGPEPTARVGLVATAGYVAFLVGPPLLGFVGEHVGLRAAMSIVFAGVGLAFLLAPALRAPEGALRLA